MRFIFIIFLTIFKFEIAAANVKIAFIDLNLKTCYFWDNGLHCFTNELEREGGPENYF